MREAANKEDVIKKVESETGLNIEIVDGKTEAQIIYSNHIAEELNTEFDYLYIDVGGGSTEITLFSKNKIVASQSFNVGTIRLLHEQVGKETWDYLKNWVTQKAKSINPLMAIGSGGNINKLYKLVHGKDTKPMTYKKLKEVSDYISEFSYEERITHLGLNDDRADVILPASKIFMTIMKTAAIDKIIVPQSGLSDGIIHLLYEQMKTQTKLFK
jgi:exopolyphosphatase/guanosine-5'-triphosphate,3'-diphosphate pyrophosphatase